MPFLCRGLLRQKFQVENSAYYFQRSLYELAFKFPDKPNLVSRAVISSLVTHLCQVNWLGDIKIFG